MNPHQQSIYGLLAEWENAKRSGKSISLEELCSKSPELLSELRAYVKSLESVEGWLGSTDERTMSPSEMEERSKSLGAADWEQASIKTASEYQVIRHHAKGGLGEVLLAKDKTLGRDVAIKVIQQPFDHDPLRRKRFLREAEITSRLDHPGIAPVHGIGADEHGRLCYAMRFIEGETLAEAAGKFHRNAKIKSQNETMLELRGLLNRFVSACKTIAYAHSKGVLHRDIKPANIILGRFGETLVIDWGLAKVISSDSTSETDEKNTHNRQDSNCVENEYTEHHLTDHKDILGTPGFMSPEQTIPGSLENVSIATDVYGLGATLYFLLVGHPPAQHDSLVRMIEKIRGGDFPRPSALNRISNSSLDAICSKAMAVDPVERYGSALDLATDVELWLADEPIVAKRDSMVELIGRITRRHRSITLTGIAAVSAVAILSTLFVILLGQSNAAVMAERNTAQGLAEKNKSLAVQEQLAKETAINLANEKVKLAALEASARKSAQEQSKLAIRTLKTVVRDIQRKLAGVNGTSEIRRGFLATSLEGLAKVAKSIDTQSEVDENTIIALSDIGGIYLLVGGETGEDATREALKFFQQANELAIKYSETSPTQESSRYVSISYEKIGEAHWQLGEIDLAESAYRLSLEVSEKAAINATDLAGANRDIAFGYEKLGDVALEKGDVASAKASYHQSREKFLLAIESLKDSALLKRDLLVALSKLGNVYFQEKDFAKATATYQESIDIVIALLEDPNTASSPRDLSVMYNKLGGALQQENKLEEANSAFASSLKIAREYLSEEPNNLQRRRDVTVSLNNLGELGLAKEDLALARTSFEESLSIRENLLEGSPDSFAGKIDLAYVLEKMGEVEEKSGNIEKTNAYYRSAMNLLEPLNAAGTLQTATSKQLFETVQSKLNNGL